MTEEILISLVSILVLGIGAQWIAWRINLPSILLLLIFGFIAGPVTGLIDPDILLGDLLLPVVSVSVAVILFEGGLSLRVSELPEIGGVIRNLMSIGLIVTWFISAAAAHFVLNLDIVLAVLFGAIIVVTGPTVIVPLLRYVQPTGQVGPVLRWEGILIDPVGAMLAVLVFEAIIFGEFKNVWTLFVSGIFKTIVIGGAAGACGAGVMVYLMKKHWIPDFLQSSVTLMTVATFFALSNLLETDSGLLSVTIMGIVLANQNRVTVKHIAEFKENLRVLLISSLFILLAARMNLDALDYININTFLFLCVLIFVARPLAVYLSTIASNFNWREKLFLSWFAPRGIVAAAVSSIFALRLSESGYPQADSLVSLTFMVIIFTVAVYGLSTPMVARWLKVAQPNPQGALIFGAHSWAREIAIALQKEGFNVLLVDINRSNIAAARMAGLAAFRGNILSERTIDEINIEGIGRLLSLSFNHEVNSLASLRFAEVFNRTEVYQLSPHDVKNNTKESIPQHLQGRYLFGSQVTFRYLATRFAAGAIIKKTNLTDEFDFEAFIAHYGENAVPLFLINENNDLMIFTVDNPPTPRAGHTLISLVDPVEESQ